MDIKCSTCKGKYQTADLTPEEVAPYFNEALGDTETLRHITSRCNCLVTDEEGNKVMCQAINVTEITISTTGEEASSAPTE